ncbi:zinc ribbon domain-containing protein [Candidatus Hydrogenedentota bacterium]
MPIYEYECDKCGHVFEALLSISSKTKPPCEECGHKKVTKLISAFGVVGSSRGGGDPDCGTCSGGSCSTCH